MSVFGTSPKEIVINYEAHEGQLEVSNTLRENFLNSDPDKRSSIIEVICSRGWGKTLWLVCDVLMPYLINNPGAKVMWVAPTYQICMSPIDDVFRGINENTGEPYIPEFDNEGNRVWEFVTSRSGPTLTLYNGSTVLFKSADSPDNIVSKGFNRIIIDEAALIEEKTFTQQILGTARKKGIKIFMITTPRGKKHWTYRYFMKGQDPNEPNYISFQQPYTRNPYFNTTLAKLIKDIPEYMYRQEYLAEFLEDGDSVIKGLDTVLYGPEITFESSQQEWSTKIVDVEISNLSGKYKRLASERRFITSLDIAKSQDFSVIFVMDLECGEIVYYKRLNKMDYRDLLELVVAVCKSYGTDLIFDATGVGSGLADMFNNYDIVTHPFVFTNESKNDIVNKLVLSVEYGELRIPNIQEIRKELSVFTYTLTKTGKLSYAAPAGFHDDIVMSLALANWFRKENSANDQIGVIEEVIGWNSGKIRSRSVEYVKENSILSEDADEDDDSAYYDDD